MIRRTQFGFSLIELMVATALSSLFAVGIYKLLRGQAQNSEDQNTSSKNLRTAQIARTQLSDDLAQAGFDPRYVDLGRSAITPVTVAASDRITIQSDHNLSGTIGDQAASDSPETVAYLYDASSGRVTRNSNIFLMNVQNFALTYYNASGATATAVPNQTITSLSQIKKVRVAWTQTAGSDKSHVEEFVVIMRNYR